MTSPASDRRRPRWLARALETHFALPLFALLPLVAIWAACFHFVETERRTAVDAAHDAVREQLDTYEAQVARNLNAIDQTLKVIKYSVELNGTHAALPTLRAEELLPPGLVFQVSVGSSQSSSTRRSRSRIVRCRSSSR